MAKYFHIELDNETLKYNVTAISPLPNIPEPNPNFRLDPTDDEKITTIYISIEEAEEITGVKVPTTRKLLGNYARLLEQKLDEQTKELYHVKY